MKFTLNTKDFKEVISKLEKTIKNSVTDDCIVFMGGNVVTFIANTADARMVIVKDSVCDDIGKFVVPFAKLKQISKLKAKDFTFDFHKHDGKLIVKADKKVQSIIGSEVNVIYNGLKKLQHVAIIPGNDLFEMMEKLSLFNKELSDAKPLMNCFNLNIGNKTMTVLDGYRIIQKDLSEYMFGDTTLTEINIPLKAYTMLKNSLKGNKNNIEIQANQDYVQFTGNDFTFFIEMVDGEYFDVDEILKGIEPTGSVELVTKELMEITKYNVNHVKGSRFPMLLHNKENKLVSYCENKHNESSMDFLDTKNNELSENFVIGFDPNFVLDALKVIQNDTFTLEVMSDKAPCKIIDNGYTIVLLPVNINIIDKFNEVLENIKTLKQSME